MYVACTAHLCLFDGLCVSASECEALLRFYQCLWIINRVEYLIPASICRSVSAHQLAVISAVSSAYEPLTPERNRSLCNRTKKKKKKNTQR